MIDERMNQVADEFVRKLMEMISETAEGGGKISLILADHLIRKYKDFKSEYIFIQIDKSDLKEYSSAFDEKKLVYKVEQVDGEDKIAILFRKGEREKYEEALKLIEESRAKINEVQLSKFIENNKDIDLSKKTSLDVVEIEKFREYANRGELEYAVFYAEGSYGIVFKDKDEKEIDSLLDRVQTVFSGKDGRNEKSRVLMQLATLKAAEIELSKADTDFIIVDTMFPNNHLVVKENLWKKKRDDLVLEESKPGITTHQHRVDVLKYIETMKDPLIMSEAEYQNKERREELIQEAYLKIEEVEATKEVPPEEKKQKEEFVSPSGTIVSFNKKWGGHEFTNEELSQLKRGETIVINDLVNKNGSYYSAEGSLRLQEIDNGSKFWGFKMEKYIPQEGPINPDSVKQKENIKTDEKVILNNEIKKREIPTEKLTLEEKANYKNLIKTEPTIKRERVKEKSVER